MLKKSLEDPEHLNHLLNFGIDLRLPTSIKNQVVLLRGAITDFNPPQWNTEDVAEKKVSRFRHQPLSLQSGGPSMIRSLSYCAILLIHFLFCTSETTAEDHSDCGNNGIKDSPEWVNHG